MVGSVSGISSGLDTESIITSIMAVKRQAVDKLTAKKELETSKQDTWSTIMSKTLGLQLSAYNLSKTSSFTARKLTVGDDTAVSATVTGTATPGSYQFIVDKLATAHQLTSTGFNDYDTTPVGAGSFTIELGNGDVKRDTLLNDLNGGQGVSRGRIKITARDDATATIDLSSAMTIDDVLKAINTAGLNVTAAVSSDGSGIDLTATSGGNTLTVEDVSGGTTAADLGIKGNAGVTNTLSGTDIAFLSSSSSLATLNDGLGVSKSGLLINGTPISLASANNLGDVVTAINAQTGITSVSASIRLDGKGIALTGAGFVIAENGGTSASDLGIFGMTNAGNGDDLYAGMNSVLLKSLNGTTGVTGTVFTIKGALDADITITGMKSLRQVIDAINAQTSSTKVAARFNAAQNGLELYSTDVSSATFSVEDKTGVPATKLGILGSAASGVLKGADLDIAYMGKNVALSTMNQGDGVRKGSIVITNKNNQTLTVNLTGSSIKTLGDVISTINAQSVTESKGITVSINSAGDGLLITDASGGSGSLRVAEMGNGHMAKDLGILGASAGLTYDGSFEKTIAVTGTYTLGDVRDAINELGVNVKASIVNDGSSNPYRLSISSTKTGTVGRMVVGSSVSSLNLNTSVAAANATLIMGDPTSENALFMSSSTNTVTTLVTGVTLSLMKASSTPISLSVVTDADSVVKSVNDFVDKYNKTITAINEQLKYDSTNNTSGPLFGDAALMLLQQEIYNTVNRDVTGVSGDIKTASQVGVTLGLDGLLTLNESTLRSMMDSNLTDVTEFFTFQNNAALTATPTDDTTPPTPLWSLSGGHDGNTKVADYATRATGYQAPNGATYELDFGSNKELSGVKVWGVDTLATDILASFSLQYQTASSTEWKTFSTITGNTRKDISIAFPSGIVAKKVRLSSMAGAGTDAKLLDFQAFESSGFAAAYDLALSKITNAGTGMISTALDGIDETQSTLDDAITRQNERLAIEEATLRKQYTQLETMLGNLKNLSSQFTSQIAGINANWGTS